MPENTQTSAPKKGAAAPLEGAVGSEIMGVLNLAFMAIGFGMIRSLALKVTPTLAASPAFPAAQAAPSQPRIASSFAAPKPKL